MQLEELGQGPELEHVVLLWAELRHGDHQAGVAVVEGQLGHGVCVAGRIDNAWLAAPEVADVVAGPGAVDHGDGAEVAGQPVGAGKEAIVEEFGGAQQRPLRHAVGVVEVGAALLHLGQHVGGDGGIVHIGADCAAAQQPEDGQGKRIAHRVHKDIRHKGQQRLQAQQQRAQALHQHGEARIVPCLHPLSPSQLHKGQAGRRRPQGQAKARLHPRQHLRRVLGHGVARVDDAKGLRVLRQHRLHARPQHTLAAAAAVAVGMEEADSGDWRSMLVGGCSSSRRQQPAALVAAPVSQHHLRHCYRQHTQHRRRRQQRDGHDSPHFHDVEVGFQVGCSGEEEEGGRMCSKAVVYEALLSAGGRAGSAGFQRGCGAPNRRRGVQKRG